MSPLLIKKCPTFNGKRRLVKMFTEACNVITDIYSKLMCQTCKLKDHLQMKNH